MTDGGISAFKVSVLSSGFAFVVSIVQLVLVFMSSVGL